MKRVGRILLGLGLAAVIGGGLYFGGGWLLLRLPGLINNPHVQPNHAVAWEAGPTRPATEGRRPPNVVVILADDLGFNDISFYGGGVADGVMPTPHIDAIAREGVNFTNGYAGNATCAPSRAAILTGRYPTRFGFEFTAIPLTMARFIGHFDENGETGHPVRYLKDNEHDLPDYHDMGVPTSEITLASLLQHHGYHTLHFGKWHLGEAARFTPNHMGFDESLGFYAGGSKYLNMYDKDSVNAHQDFDPIDKFLWADLPYFVRYNGGAPFKPSEYMTDYLGEQAVQAIHANRNRPFFMYLAFNAPHTPLQARREDYDALPQIKDHRLRVYAAMIRALDRNVGRVTDALKAEGLDQNTLVIFTSDNGGANYIGLPKINQPYRGWKMTFFEGGVHTPYFMRWPGVIPAGARYERPVSHFDIFATTAAAAGAPMPNDRVMDGVDLAPYIQGKAVGEPHPILFWRSGGYATVRAGDWKLQVLKDPSRIWLFNLKDDPTEHHDLSKALPAKVAELQAALARHDAEQGKPLWKPLLAGPIPIDHPLGQPVKPGEDFVYWNN